MSLDRDKTPCYLATCPECQGVVMICVADPSNPSLMRSALRDRGKCERDGMNVETMAVSEGKARLAARFGHQDDCSRDPRRERRLQKAMRQKPLLVEKTA